MSPQVDKEINYTEVLIIGGGITGAGIFRDLSLHNIDVTLIEANDFSSKTSQSSTKMLHGGIRYLENFDLPLIFEALGEKNLWIKNTPHLAKEKPFLLPTFTESKRPLWQIAIGLFVYDLLSGFKNSPFKILNKEKTLEHTPILTEKNLEGAGIYYDAIIDDSKMTLEVIFDALINKKAKAFSYHKLTQYDFDGKTHTCVIEDLLNKKTKIFKSTHIVFTLGPYTDELLKKFNSVNWTPKLAPSKGSHIWFHKNDFPMQNPLVITTKDERVIFVVPHGDLILVGTTEIPIDNLEPTITKKEVHYLIENINQYFPHINITADKIIGHFSGIRPLIREEGESLSKTSREHKSYMINQSGHVISGGKYTTFRTMGQEITENIVRSYQKAFDPSLSLNPFRKKCLIPAFINFKVDLGLLIQIIKTEEVKTFEDLIERRLSCNSKKIFNHKTGLDFDSFFNENFNELNKYLTISKSDIENFKSGTIDQIVF